MDREFRNQPTHIGLFGCPVAWQGKMTFSINGAGFMVCWVANRKKGNLPQYYTTHNINSRWIIDLNVKDKMINLPEETHKRISYCLWAKIS